MFLMNDSTALLHFDLHSFISLLTDNSIFANSVHVMHFVFFVDYQFTVVVYSLVMVCAKILPR